MNLTTKYDCGRGHMMCMRVCVCIRVTERLNNPITV